MFPVPWSPSRILQFPKTPQYLTEFMINIILHLYVLIVV